MRELLSFFIRNSKWFVFLLYATASCVLLFKSNPYQHHVFLTSANAVSATVYELTSNVSSYFHLREVNDDLNQRNAMLSAEVEQLRSRVQQMEDILAEDTMRLPQPLRQYDFVVAHVINNSVSRPNNYITINKGSLDGIGPEMGVIDAGGVVGVVNVVGPHSARVISLLNPKFRLSCKIAGSDNFGSLVWDGEDPQTAVLEDLPRHTVYHDGDTVVTSGYSAVFPAGITVGTVIPGQHPQSNNSISLRVRLATDFTTLSNVQVVINHMLDEIKQIEASDDPAGKK